MARVRYLLLQSINGTCFQQMLKNFVLIFELTTTRIACFSTNILGLGMMGWATSYKRTPCICIVLTITYGEIIFSVEDKKEIKKQTILLFVFIAKIICTSFAAGIWLI